MWDLSWKKILVTLGLSIAIWFLSVFVQFFTFFKVKFTLFSSSSCQLTGFPIADCIYESPDQMPYWVIDLINIFFWFWIIHFFWGWFNKNKS